MNGIEILFQQISDGFAHFMTYMLPLIGQALLVLVVGWIISALARKLVKGSLRAMGTDVLFARIAKDTSTKPSQVAGLLVYGLLLLAAVLLALDVLGLEAASTLLTDMLSYLPRLAVALVMLGLGLYLVDFVGKIINSLDPFRKPGIGPWLQVGVRGLLLTLVLLAVAEQLDIATSFLIVAFAAIMGGLALTLVIACGFGGREAFASLLAGYALKKHIRRGDTITWQGMKGRVSSIGLLVTEITGDGETRVINNSLLLSHGEGISLRRPTD